MSLHLVTGYAGKAHVTSADQGAFNAGVVGTSEYVMGTGFQLSAQVISNNQIRIFDGDIMMQGRHICLKKDTYEDVAIANGLQGLNRNDLIVLRYTKDANTGVESIAFAVLQGVSTEGTASDPVHTTGDILSGECLLSEMPLYRVPLTGLNVGELVPLFTVVDSMADHNHDGRYYTEEEVDAKVKEIDEKVNKSLNVRYNEETDMIQIKFIGEWTDWRKAGLSWNGYIFNNGDECRSVTGGWTLSQKGTFNGASSFGVTSTSIKFYSQSAGHSGTSILATEKLIDFKGFTKIRIKGFCRSADNYTTTFAFGFGSSRSTMDKTLYSKTVNSSTVVTIDQTYDLSSYQDGGAKYFMLSAVNSSSGYAELNITEIQFFNE
jgi:hypothetical protein